MIPIYKPYLPNYITKYAHDAIDSSWISSHGNYINIVKDEIKKISQSKFVILTNNGTSATHLMAIGLKHKFKDNSLVVPNNVYVAAWNMFKVEDCHFITIDANIDTWNADYSKLKKDLPAAFLIVHNVGNVINVPKLKREYKNAIFVEDNCEGFLGSYENKPTGSASLMSSVSFFGNKTITTGEGGALFTDDEELFEYLNSVRGQGYTDQKFIFDKIGYNYRMTNIQAALLYGQLKYLPEILERKTEVFNLYRKELKGVKNIEFQKIEKDTIHSNWLLGIKFNGINLKSLTLHLYENGIETRPMFPPITYHKQYSDMKCSITNAQKLYDTCLILPSYPELKSTEIKYICQTIKNYIRKNASIL